MISVSGGDVVSVVDVLEEQLFFLVVQRTLLVLLSCVSLVLVV